MAGYLKIFAVVVEYCENWFEILCGKLLGWPLASIRLRNGVKFIVPNRRLAKADLSMFAEIWAYQFYNPPFFDIAAGDVVFDVGANNGYFTVFAARQAKSGQVHAFEPVPVLATAIRSNASQNRLGNVTVAQLALAGGEGETDFFLSVAHNGCHSLFRRSAKDVKIRVRTDSLENYCRRHLIQRIDFLKLDCEGAEYDILLTMTRGMLARIGRISMELHDTITDHTHEEIEEFLRARGFFVTVKNWYLYALNPLLWDPKM